jgi:putative toxin-antitoxin system antitoxin component (TIGR02293 family)
MTAQLMPKVRKRRSALLRRILEGTAPPSIEVFEAIRRGLAANELNEILAYGLSLVEVASALGVSTRTLLRKREDKKPFDTAASDRLVRLANVLRDTDRYIGNHAKALGWLRDPNWGLGNRAPLDMLSADVGVELVRRSLVTIAYGGVA